MEHYDDLITGRKWWSRLYMHRLWGTDDNKIAQQVLDFIPNDFKGQLLDVPIGTAVFTHAKYKQMMPAKIVGVDFSEEMIDFATLRKQENNIENLILQQGDVGNLPFENESFDCVLSMNGFHVFPDKDKAFVEVWRVLKPGGLFCGCFYIKGQRTVADWFARNVLERKGFFKPPYYTLAEAENKLRSLYGENVQVSNSNSMLIFKCLKF